MRKLKMKQFNEFYTNALVHNLSYKLAEAGVTPAEINKLTVNILNEDTFSEQGFVANLLQRGKQLFQQGKDFVKGRFLGSANNVESLKQQAKQVKGSLSNLQQSLVRMGVPAEKIARMFENMMKQVDNALNLGSSTFARAQAAAPAAGAESAPAANPPPGARPNAPKEVRMPYNPAPAGAR